MFYILMILDLILIGASFFLWFQLNRDTGEASGGGIFTKKERLPRTPKPTKTSSIGKPKAEKKKKNIFGKRNVEEIIDDEISWDNFEIASRKKGSIEEQRDMDEMFGFETKKDNGILERAKSNSRESKRNKSLEEEFGDLFSDDEKKEITDTFEPNINNNVNRDKGFDEFADFEKPNKSFDDFSEFENFQLGDEPNEVKAEPDDDAYDFLKNYDFDSKKEEVNDDIFDRARNQRSDKSTSNDDWDLDDVENELSSIGRSNYDEKPINKRKELETPKKSAALDDEEDDIFARLQRLSNMMDQQKK